ncbi:MAG: Muconate cycloisomerase 1 [Planctomycetota bacterium]|jgi:L-alanine-DL-glutamate epimerase-like enolase superfamily enzyme
MRSTEIEAIDTFIVRYPISRRFRFLKSQPSSRATRDTVLVRVKTAGGETGWGQCVPSRRWSYETLETVRSTIDLYLRPALLGVDAVDREAIGRIMEREIAPGFTIGQPICKAGLDLALFDLVGKVTKQPAHQRWGRSFQSAVTLSWTLDVGSEGELESEVAEATRRGYCHFNVKVGQDAKRDEAICVALRKQAPDARIWVDANGGYDLATATALSKKFAALGIFALEQPLPANRLSDYQQLRRLGALPIVMDEGVISRVDLQEFHRLGLLDGVAMKVSRCGGLHESRAMLEYMEQEGLLFMASGLTDPDLAFAASLLLFGAYGLKLPAALNGPQFLDESILHTPIEVIGDQARVPVGNGLAVDVCGERLASAG